MLDRSFLGVKHLVEFVQCFHETFILINQCSHQKSDMWYYPVGNAVQIIFLQMGPQISVNIFWDVS